MAQDPDVEYDASKMPRLDRAPVSESEHREVYRGPVRHESMQDVAMRTLMWNRDVANALAPLGDYLRSSHCLPRRHRARRSELCGLLCPDGCFISQRNRHHNDRCEG